VLSSPWPFRPRTDNAENNVEEKAFARNPLRVERDRGLADSPLEENRIQTPVSPPLGIYLARSEMT
jgi:hypothetical protein